MLFSYGVILHTYVKFLTSRGDVFVFWVDLVTEMTVETYLKHLRY
jgi:hypothetical protein